MQKFFDHDGPNLHRFFTVANVFSLPLASDGPMRFLPALLLALALPSSLLAADTIDRRALVSRHNPVVTRVDPWAPLSVGNGRFAFTADITGLQTFGDYYHANGIPLETLARWAWHENPNPSSFKLADANQPFTAHGRTVGYPTNASGPAGRWLRENPHDVPLAQLALNFTRASGVALQPDDIRAINQTLDLWTGTVTSRFTVVGSPVTVTVACDPATDTLAVRLVSPLVATGKLGVRLAFPRGHDLKVKNNPALDWTNPEAHATTIASQNDKALTLTRTIDATRYQAAVNTAAPATFVRAGPHTFQIRAVAGDTLDFTLSFAPEKLPATPAPAAVRSASITAWGKFWTSGGAVDFTGSTDPRATELERRVVLSQYLTAIQFAGDVPPQESGLTNSTWYGKHHTEMIWWHTAHFALWGRDAYLAKNLEWYQRTLPVARAIATERGLRGARWPKMVGPDGRESPGGNPLIIWNQPHVIHLAELLYRNTPTAEMLERYRELVQATAEAMASMLHFDKARDCYVLGPPLWIAQEIYDQATSQNPTYELSYWARGFTIAQEWRERLGLPRDGQWERMRTRLAPLPQKDGRYVALESTPDTWDNKDSRHDHPSFLMAFGQLPGDGVDRAVMRRTLDATLATWDWETKIWGWDYPMIAMTAARLGAPKQAVDILLKNGPNNGYKPNGHNPQRGDLPVYLPGNGALLAAVALMAGGWDGAPPGAAPGFPRDGTWTVRAEGLNRLP